MPCIADYRLLVRGELPRSVYGHLNIALLLRISYLFRDIKTPMLHELLRILKYLRRRAILARHELLGIPDAPQNRSLKDLRSRFLRIRRSR